MFERYAIYFTATGVLGARGAAWLGWDIATGDVMPHPMIKGVDLASVTARPRKYGFHATLKAPFCLADGADELALIAAVAELCQHLAPAEVDGLQVAPLGPFLALVPQGDTTDLSQMAAAVVRELDGFRAPAGADELARRRKANLSPAQEAHLAQWGYPHVMDQFRFHMTLTGRLPRADIARMHAVAGDHFADVLPRPLHIDALTIAGETATGLWTALKRIPLG